MSEMVPWRSGSTDVVPAEASTASEIAQYARQLSSREQQQVVSAFEEGNYEIGAGFLWNRAMAALKKRLESLGSDFIGEMLDRSDIGSESSLTRVLTDHDAVRLAEKLGMFNSTQAMRLRNAMEVVNHFSQPPGAGEDGSREMVSEEAISVLRACVQTSLGQEDLGGALEFAAFRDRLESEQLAGGDAQVTMLAESSAFFVGTAVRVLMALAKTAEGAKLEHVLGNANVVVPAIWATLPEPDKWLVGRTYAELHAAGKKNAIAGMRQVLLKVSGFDFVPEDLRSRAFIESAARLEAVHHGLDNYYHEPSAVRELASLGTVIPTPALPQVMTALLSVRLGNRYGHSWNAQDLTEGMLRGLTVDRWRYYFDQVLPRDSSVLVKLLDPKPRDRWMESVVGDFGLLDTPVRMPVAQRLLQASRPGREDQLSAVARAAYAAAVGDS